MGDAWDSLGKAFGMGMGPKGTFTQPSALAHCSLLRGQYFPKETWAGRM